MITFNSSGSSIWCDCVCRAFCSVGSSCDSAYMRIQACWLQSTTTRGQYSMASVICAWRDTCELCLRVRHRSYFQWIKRTTNFHLTGHESQSNIFLNDYSSSIMFIIVHYCNMKRDSSQIIARRNYSSAQRTRNCLLVMRWICIPMDLNKLWINHNSLARFAHTFWPMDWLTRTAHNISTVWWFFLLHSLPFLVELFSYGCVVHPKQPY